MEVTLYICLSTRHGILTGLTFLESFTTTLVSKRNTFGMSLKTAEQRKIMTRIRCAREIKDRVLSKIEPIPYSLIWYNCEHFASWCRYDTHWSEQVDAGLTWFLTVIVCGWFVYAALNGGNEKK